MCPLFSKHRMFAALDHGGRADLQRPETDVYPCSARMYLRSAATRSSLLCAVRGRKVPQRVDEYHASTSPRMSSSMPHLLGPMQLQRLLPADTALLAALTWPSLRLRVLKWIHEGARFI